METGATTKITSSAVTDRGLSEKRPENEDSHLELIDHGLFVVADGVGGAQAGDVASQMAVEILGEAFMHQSQFADAEDVMRLAIQRANEAIFHMAQDLPQLASMATTIVALQITGNIATIGHVGDSRVYRVAPDARIHRETDDHSVVEEEVRAGRMTPEQALNHPSRNVISRALGAEATVDVDIKTVMVEPGSYFLLCSDGITRHIPDREIEEIFEVAATPAAITNRLKATCYERGAEDNLTAIVVHFEGGANDTKASIPVGEDIGFEAAQTRDVAGDFDTVATARPIEDVSGQIGLDAPGAVAADDSTAVFESFDLGDEESYPSDELSQNTEYKSSSVVVPAQAPVTVDIPSAVALKNYNDYLETEASQNSPFSKLVSAAFLLIIGALLGAAAYYFLLAPIPQPEPQPLPTLVEQSSNVPLTAFEDGRRLVDKDPAAFLNANAASPENADDFFLLGRAFLLTGKYWEAKRAFNEAKNRLAQADPKNAKTLSIEIAMATAMIETPGAAETFAKDIYASNTANGSASNANANVNTSANFGLPVR
ncbi:MAG: protein phosphatase 2C domain-containing protein [Pyrinomonadaceae bacterium]